MTGRRLYDALTDGWAEENKWSRAAAVWLKEVPPAWRFLSGAERTAFNAAARALTPKPNRHRGAQPKASTAEKAGAGGAA